MARPAPLRALEHLAFRVLVAAIRALPNPAWVARAGRLMGHLSRLLSFEWRRRIRHNLRLVYGERLAPARRRAIVRGVFEHSGRGFCELLWDSRAHGICVADLVDLEGGEHLDGALARGRGVLLATAHIGSWTMVPRYLQEKGYTVASLLRLPSNPAARDAERGAVERLGLTCFTTPLSRADVHACLRLLRGGGCLFIAADRRAHDVKCDFLGVPAWCATGTAALHFRTGAAIVPVHTVRVGLRHRIALQPALEITYSGNREQDAARITQQLHDTFGAWIRACPEQWMWNHLRWRPRRREIKGVRA